MSDEPALRPAGGRGPGLERCHGSRLSVEDGALVLRARGRTRRIPVGAGGVVRAVFVDAPGGQAARQEPGRPGAWGEVRLLDGEGAPVARTAVEEWLPEAPALPPGSVQGEQLLERSGVAGLLKAAGVPLHVAGDRNGARKAGSSGVSLGPGPAFPLWYWCVRAVAGTLWFSAFTVVVFSDTAPGWLVLLLALTALCGPVARLALRGWTRLRAGRRRVTVVERVVPSPAPGAGATVRFLRETELRVQDRDLVLRDLGGQEYWFARSGPHAVTRLVRVTDGTGRPVGVELRGPGEHVRAALPWDLWFAGEDGADGWSRLCRATGLTVSERRLSGRRTWPKGPVLGTGLLPRTGGEARRAARFPGTAAGVSSTAVMAFGSVFSVVQGVRVADTAPGAGAVAVAAGALGLVLQAVPYAVHELRGRLVLDRPAAERTPEEARR
ncbi:hypothetical protein FB570_114121 [Streptomyces sp. T12]|uniref:hypothetical protein n=1 Tax=Streptomyces sp. T12 TaxID=477697 RepID=UPI0011AB276D|nr:hypothetical protein [Streptomyces sp. T12]TWD14932.1 hypothetical protein FB570_114121 [Streptomyces sp. T12]